MELRPSILGKACLILGLLILAGATSVSTLPAQTNLATIRGTVTDASGAVIPSASIVLTNVETNAVRKTITNADGDYEMPYVHPGTYRLNCTAKGFQSFVADDIVITGFETRRINATLRVGTVSTQVTVKSGAAVISTENGQIVGGISHQKYLESPVGQVAFPQAIMLTAPLVQADQGGFSLTIAGIPHNQTEESLDGVENDGTVNLVQNMNDYTDLRIIATNSTAQFSRAVNFSMTGRSGTNQYHGKVWYTMVNSALNARNPLEPTKTPFKSHQGAVQFSGPIQRDRTFFYGAYYLTRIPASSFFNRNVPSLAERSGDFSQLLTQANPVQIIDPTTGAPFQNNMIPSKRISAVSSKVQQLYIPEPNQGAPGLTANNFGYLFPHPSDLYKGDYWTGRVDHNFSSKHSIFGRYEDRHTPYILAGSFPQVGTWTRNRYHFSTVVSDTYTFSPSWVNNFRWGWNHNHIEDGITTGGVTPTTGDQAVSAIGLQGVNPQGLKAMGFPDMTITGVSSLFQRPGGVISNENILQYTDDVTHAMGRHVLKFGGEVKTFRNFNSQVPTGTYGNFSFDGSFTGNAYADFLLGLPRTSSRLNPIVGRTERYYEMGYYVEDSFKMTPKVTLNYGLRWDYFGPSSYADGLMYRWDPTTGDVVVPANALNKVSPLYPSNIKVVAGQAVPNPAKDNFRFRLGVAYRLTNRTVIRGGYGTYTETLGDYARLQGVGPFQIAETYINSVSNGTPLFSFPDPFPAGGSAVVPSQSVAGYPLNTDNGVIHEFNLSVEHEIKTVGVRLSYVGSRGRGLNYTVGQINIPQPSLIPFSQSRRPYPEFVGVSNTYSNGETNYDALDVEAKKEIGSFSFMANYTYANSMNNYGNLENPYNLGLWNHDAYTARHRAVIMFNYDLPFGAGRAYLNRLPGTINTILGGWHASWLSTFQSGQFFTPAYSGADPSNTDTFGGIPDRIGNGNLPGTRIPDHWFNASAFGAPAPGGFGNSGVNILEGPGINVQNLAIRKTFSITERFKLQYQAYLMDLFNTPTYKFPYNNISVPSQVGRVHATLGGQTTGAGLVETGAEREINMRLSIEF